MINQIDDFKFIFGNGVDFPSLAQVEKFYWDFLYRELKGNTIQMARKSGISRATIYRKLIEYFGVNFREHFYEANGISIPYRKNSNRSQ